MLREISVDGPKGLDVSSNSTGADEAEHTTGASIKSGIRCGCAESVFWCGDCSIGEGDGLGVRIVARV